MPRRKPGTLLPLETEILEVALSMRRSGHASFHGFGLAQTLREQSGSRALTGHGTLYKALGRLEDSGLLASRWEDAAAVEGRPRRRLYELTGKGAGAAEDALAAHRAQPTALPHASPRGPHDAGAHGRAGGTLRALLHAQVAPAGRPAPRR